MLSLNPYLYSTVFIVIFSVLTFGYLFSPLYLQRDRVSKFQSFSRRLLFFFTAIIILFLGLRPISDAFVDMETYVYMIEQVSLLGIRYESDFLFFYIGGLINRYWGIGTFFFLVAFFYCYGYSRFILYTFTRHRLLAFFLLCSSLFFFSYGVNTIRNGVASSLFLIGLTFCERKKLLFYLFLILAVMMHSSMILPVLVYFFVSYCKRTMWYIFVWFLSIPFSFLSGSFFNKYLSIIFSGTRLSSLASEVDPSLFSMVGFRWDFVLFSSVPIFVGLYYIQFRRFKDTSYEKLLSFYILTNAVWIWLIEAPYSDRYAYLSWFIYPFLIVLPQEKMPLKKFLSFPTMVYFILIVFSLYRTFQK